MGRGWGGWWEVGCAHARESEEPLSSHCAAEGLPCHAVGGGLQPQREHTASAQTPPAGCRDEHAAARTGGRRGALQHAAGPVLRLLHDVPGGQDGARRHARLAHGGQHLLAGVRRHPGLDDLAALVGGWECGGGASGLMLGAGGVRAHGAARRGHRHQQAARQSAGALVPPPCGPAPVGCSAATCRVHPGAAHLNDRSAAPLTARHGTAQHIDHSTAQHALASTISVSCCTRAASVAYRGFSTPMSGRPTAAIRRLYTAGGGEGRGGGRGARASGREGGRAGHAGRARRAGRAQAQAPRRRAAPGRGAPSRPSASFLCAAPELPLPPMITYTPSLALHVPLGTTPVSVDPLGGRTCPVSVNSACGRGPASEAKMRRQELMHQRI